MHLRRLKIPVVRAIQELQADHKRQWWRRWVDGGGGSACYLCSPGGASSRAAQSLVAVTFDSHGGHLHRVRRAAGLHGLCAVRPQGESAGWVGLQLDRSLLTVLLPAVISLLPFL